MAWTVAFSHYPPLFIGGFLFFLAFSQATGHHQGKMDLRGPMLVGFFLAGLVIHEAQMIPSEGQVFSFHGFRFEILKKRRHQITALRMSPVKREGEIAET